MDVHRIVAHRDFDGLVSALLLQELLGVEEVVFYEPWEHIAVHRTDAAVGLPFFSECALWIDHHATNKGPEGPQYHHDASAPSCPTLIAKIFGPRTDAYLALIRAAEHIDTASFTREELQQPTPAMQIAMTVPGAPDHYLVFLLEQLRTQELAEVAALHIVQEHYAKVRAQQQAFLQLETMRHGNVLVVEAEHAPAFAHLLLCLEHDEPISLIITPLGDRLRISAGVHLFNPATSVDIGATLREYGGGGHAKAAGCTIPAAEKEEILDRLLAALNQ